MDSKNYIIDENVYNKLKEECFRSYEEFINSKSSIDEKSLGCYSVNLTKNMCSNGYTQQGRDVEILTDVSVDAFFDFVYLRVKDKERFDKFKSIFNRENIIKEFENGKKCLELEHMYLKLKSERKWVRTCINCIQNPHTNDIEGIIFVEDITDEKYRKMMIDALIKKKYSMLMCVDAITEEYTLYIDSETSLNSMYSGNNYEELIEKYSNKRLRDKDKQKFIETNKIDNILKNLKSANSQYSKVFEIYDNNNKVTYQQLEFMYMDYNSKQVLITYTDITESIEERDQKNKKLKDALKQVKRANRAKSEFLSRMSHDMRTPMNGIIGVTDILLSDGTISDSVRKKLIEMKEAEDLLLSLVNDILDMQKIESNKLVLSKQFYPFVDIIKNIELCIRPQLSVKDIKFNISYEEIKKCNIYVDKLRISQVFINILSNSIKFTPNGGTINCEIKKLGLHDDVADIEVSISDSGIGMSEEFLEHIFEPFEQENNEISSSHMGTGLGMAIVKNIIELMGGSIDIKSSKGVGTTTVVRLSFKVSEEKPKQLKEQSSDYKNVNNLEGKRVLLCEDNELNIKVAASMLKERKMEVITAKNGQEAIDIFVNSEPETFDIILMDIRMPIINGLKASSIIRKLERSDAKTIPIVALTANAYNQEIEVCRQAGMNAHIAKPINIKLFYSVIENELLKAEKEKMV